MIALYHFITFITLLHLSFYRFYRIYHLITFLIKKPSLLPVIIGTGFGSGFSPFAPGTAGALLATLIWFGLPVSGLLTAWRHLGAKTLRAWWSMKWSVCGLPCLRRPPDMYGMHWEHLSCSVCLIYSSPWAFAVWKVCRVESG